MFSRFIVVVGLVLTLASVTYGAEDKPADSKAADTKAVDTKASDTKASDSKAPDAKTTDAKGVDAPAATKQAKEPKASESQFDTLMKQWTELRDELEKLQVDYKSTPPAERKPVIAKFNEGVARGAALEEQMQQVADKAYRASQGDDEKAGEFLQSLAVRYLNQERYERALAAAAPVVETKARNARMYNLAGTGAYYTNDYDLADKYFKQAETAGVLDRMGKNLLSTIPEAKKKWAAEAAIRTKEAAANDLPRVELTTTKGRVVLELFENEAPQAVANFVNLVEKGFYNGLSFHRVINGFMAQGGDPKGDGSGGPGYHIACECYAPEHRLHFRGSLSMAHAGKNTGGSQFFITFVPTSHLDGQHTVFGRVLEGMDIVSQFVRTEAGHDANSAKPDKIIEAHALRKRAHAYEPNKLP